MAGDAQGEAGAEQASGVRGGSVGLADMGAVAAGGRDQVGTVVQQEGDAAGLGDGAQRVDRATPMVVGGFLEAELDGGDVAGIERGGQGVGEGRAGGGGGDEVEAAGVGQGSWLRGLAFPGGATLTPARSRMREREKGGAGYLPR